MVELPYQIQISGIFRAQSGFHFSRQPASGVLVDPDGDASVNGIDVNAGRNAFTTPPFVNLDMRFAKRFNITSGVKAQVLLEFFNVFNRQNPAAVGRRQDVPLEPFGRADTGPARTRGADRFPDRVLTGLGPSAPEWRRARCRRRAAAVDGRRGYAPPRPRG